MHVFFPLVARWQTRVGDGQGTRVRDAHTRTCVSFPDKLLL